MVKCAKENRIYPFLQS